MFPLGWRLWSEDDLEEVMGSLAFLSSHVARWDGCLWSEDDLEEVMGSSAFSSSYVARREKAGSSGMIWVKGHRIPESRGRKR